MKKNYWKMILVMLAFSFAALITTVHAVPKYKIIDLGTLGGTYSIAFAINDAGQVVGYSSIAGDSEYHATLWSNGTVQDLRGGGTFSIAYAINDADQVAGFSQPANAFLPHAVIWSNGTVQDLGTLEGGTTYSMAYGINEAGQVVGMSTIAGGIEYRAFLWSDGTMQNLGTLGGPYSMAYGINDAGQVVGFSYIAGGNEHAALWSNDTIQDLGTLGGTASVANAINNLGQVVGVACLAGNGVFHATLWSNGTVQDLDPLGPTGSEAYAINDIGQVVGIARTAVGGDYYAALWCNGLAIDLNSRIDSTSWYLYEAGGINNEGYIVGYGDVDLDGDGTFETTHAFLLTPYPYIEVAIDIKPGVYPNSMNFKSLGTVAVAILTTTDFDASTVDATTVKFADASPKRWKMADVDHDGDMDMLLHFNTQDLNSNSTVTAASLIGQTTAGIYIEGIDSVVIVQTSKK